VRKTVYNLSLYHHVYVSLYQPVNSFIGISLFASLVVVAGCLSEISCSNIYLSVCYYLCLFWLFFFDAILVNINDRFKLAMNTCPIDRETERLDPASDLVARPRETSRHSIPPSNLDARFSAEVQTAGLCLDIRQVVIEAKL